jgi:DNA-binding response OmpR family regulator
MYNILIVDDEIKIREILKEYAEFEGFSADMAGDGFEAVSMAKEHQYDLIIMDIMMPKLDGFSAVKKIRGENDSVSFLMLSARGEEYDKLYGFELGIDDYVVKPFSPKEVMARIKAIMKRRENKAATLSFEGLKLDEAGRNVFVDGEKINMTPKEYDLLFYLARRKGQAASRESILKDVWGYDFYGADRTIDTHIKMIRSNLKDYGKFIVTVRGIGYKFET